MMDFLRAIAPHHGNARHRAVAAVRSRFEADRPMQSVSSANPGGNGDEHDVVAEPRPVEGVVSHTVAPRIVAPRAEAPADSVHLTVGQVDLSDARHQVEPSRAEARSVVDIPLPSTEVAPVVDIPSPSTQLAGVRRVPVRDVTNERPRTAATRTEPVISALTRLPDSAEAMPAVPAAAALALARHAAVPERPLSRQAVLSRVEQPGERRPVVHVTIDRIDVRAPAAPERTVPRNRPRSASSNGSLAEYLRTKQPGRTGGVK